MVFLEKDLILGNIEGNRKRRWQRMKWIDGIMETENMNLDRLQEIEEDERAWCTMVHEVRKNQT